MTETKTRLAQATAIRALAALPQSMRLRAFGELIAAESRGRFLIHRANYREMQSWWTT